MNAIQEQTKTNAELHKELNMALAELVKKEEKVDELSNVNSCSTKSQCNMQFKHVSTTGTFSATTAFKNKHSTLNGKETNNWYKNRLGEDSEGWNKSNRSLEYRQYIAAWLVLTLITGFTEQNSFHTHYSLERRIALDPALIVLHVIVIWKHKVLNPG